MLYLTCLSTKKAHLQHLAESNVKILGKNKNLNMNKTEISLSISLIRYYVVFLVPLLAALGICRLKRFCRLLHCYDVKLDMTNEDCSDRKYHATSMRLD